ncbi:MAG: FecR domain-containing protein [Cyclobacteriaceae bacterium]
MKYQDYESVDFIKDEIFVDWVTNPNTQYNDFWKEYITANPDKLTKINLAKQFINSLEYEEHEALRSNEYVEMFENIMKRGKPEISRIIKMHPVRKVLKYTAVFSLLLLSFIAYNNQNGADDNIARGTKIPLAKNNPRGQKLLSILPDGTRVKLNSESTLVIDSRFGQEDRRVTLHGEAFFEVARDTKRPFIISTDNLVTRVLGTSFNFRSYSDEEKVQLLVVNGKVSVYDNYGDSMILKDHEMLEYDLYKHKITKSVCDDLKPYIGWKDGILIFDNDPYDTVIKKIEKWYDVRVQLSRDIVLTGEYSAEYHNKSLKKVLDGWSFASGFKYEINNEREILIKH